MWGKGIYFAANANYSCPGYSYSVPALPSVYEVFLANVIIGNTIDTGVNSRPYSNSKEPPPDPNNPGFRYDSITGFTNKSVVYIVYKNVKTYPGILVRY